MEVVWGVFRTVFRVLFILLLDEFKIKIYMRSYELVGVGVVEFYI